MGNLFQGSNVVMLQSVRSWEKKQLPSLGSGASAPERETKQKSGFSGKQAGRKKGESFLTQGGSSQA